MVFFQIFGELKGKHSVINIWFHAYFSALLPRASRIVVTSAIYRFSSSSWKRSSQYVGSREANSEFLLTRFRFRCYSSRRFSKKKKSETQPVMKDDKEAFFVVRKGDVVGVYKSLTDCQAQVGSSVTNLIPYGVYNLAIVICSFQ